MRIENYLYKLRIVSIYKETLNLEYVFFFIINIYILLTRLLYS